MRKWGTSVAVLAVAVLGLPGVASAVEMPESTGAGTLERLLPTVDAPGGSDTAQFTSFGASYSWNGRYLTYGWGKLLSASWAPDPFHVVVRDLTDGSERIFAAPAPRYTASSVTDDGNYLVFETTEAIAAEDTDTLADVYRWNLATGAKTLESGDIPAGQPAYTPQISAAGDRIVFVADPDPANGSKVDRFGYVRDVAAGTTSPLAGAALSWRSELVRMSGDGSTVAFVTYDKVVPSAPGNVRTLYLQDLDTAEITRASSNQFGYSASSPVLDLTGDTVAFQASSYSVEGAPSTTYVSPKIRVFDRRTGTETVLDDANAGPGGLNTQYYDYPVVSANGRYVGFTAVMNTATTYLQGLVHDRWTGTTVRPARRADGELPTNWHGTAILDINRDGQIAFESDSNDLVNAFRTTSSLSDVFLRTYPASYGLPDTTLAPIPAVTSASPTFTFAAHSRARYDCALDGSVWQPCTSPFTVGPLTAGAHDLAVRATDPDGRVEPVPGAASFTVDATPAQTPELSGPTGLIATATPTWTFPTPEAGATFQCRVDTAAWAPCASPWTPTLSEGGHHVAVRAVDDVGNVDALPQERMVTVDTVAPVLALAGPALTRDSTPTFTFSATGAASAFTCQVDGGAPKPCSSPFTPSVLGDGAHRIAVRASDLAGNRSGERVLAVVVDTRAPQTSIMKGPALTTTDRTPSWTFRSNQGGSTFQCKIDSGKWKTCSQRWTAPTQAKRKHTLYVRAKDPAGNLDATPVIWKFTVK